MNTQRNGYGKKDELKFPVKFDLKIIMVTIEDLSISIGTLENLLTSLSIPFKNWRHKSSGKGSYTSFTVYVSIQSQDLMNKLYEELRKIPGVKTAL